MVARLLPAVVLLAAGFYLMQALKLPLGTAARPGAGFYPTIVAVFACVVGLVATARAFTAPRVESAKAARDPEAAAVRRRVSSTTLALGGFCVAMPWIGYPVTAAAFVIVVLRSLGSRWWTALSLGAVSAVGSHYLFAVLLDVPLPRGPW